jgi:hypothetical protein
MSASSLRPSTDEDAKRLVSIIDEERRLSAAQLMPRLGIYSEQVGPVSAIVKFLHIVARARRSLSGMGFDICTKGTGPDALYWVGKHSFDPPELKCPPERELRT